MREKTEIKAFLVLIGVSLSHLLLDRSWDEDKRAEVVLRLYGPNVEHREKADEFNVFRAAHGFEMSYVWGLGFPLEGIR